MELHAITLATNTVQKVSPELLLQQLRSGVPVLVVDVRDREELMGTGAIGGARCLPLSQLGARLSELSQHAYGCVVVVSQDDRRSTAAATTLAVAGFAEVAALEGGMTRWLALGYPVEQRGPDSVRAPLSRRG
jgi:rhodanese-related sulfurtransferase